MFDEAPPLAKYVHAALVPVVDLIAPNCGVAVGRDPNAREVVRVDFVI